MSSANRCTNLSKEREIVMPRFFLEELDESDVCITGPDARHIGLSLRMRVGEMLTVCAYGRDYQCRIRSITPEEVHLDVVSSELCAAEPTVALTLYQAVPKADKLEQIIQKSVELGAVRIVPVLTRRCISRPKAAEFQKKLPRLQKIAASAAKQAGRGIIPEVAPMLTFAQACAEMQQADRTLLLYEGGGVRFSEVNLTDCRTLALVVGSEGGFDPEEAEQLKQNGAVPVWLGHRILRCETAPLAAIAIAMHRTKTKTPGMTAFRSCRALLYLLYHMRENYSAPSLRRTATAVFARIFASVEIERSRMYFRSSSTHSSNIMLLLPEHCQ